MQTKDEQKQAHQKKDKEPDLFSRVVKLAGHWNATLKDQYGNYKTHIEGHNVITDSGVAFLANFFTSAAATAATFNMRYMGIGTNSTAEAASNTALGTEVSRHTGVVSYVSGGIFKVVATFAAGSGTGDIVEYGIFSANSSGTMLNRATQSAIAKGAGDILEVTCQVTLSN